MTFIPSRPRGRFAIVISSILLLPILLFFYGSPWPSAGPVDPYFGLLKDPQEPTLAIATFLDDSSKGVSEDYYFVASRILTYQTLYANKTRCTRPVTFLVLVTPGVSQQKRRQLEKDGAKVVEVQDIPLPWWVVSTVSRWKNQFSKLRLLEMVEYDRVLFIDADTLITRPLDEIFEDHAVLRASNTMLYTRPTEIRADEAQIPAQYVFAARSDNAYGGKRGHSYPPTTSNSFSAGFWMAAPSQELFNYLMSILRHPLRFAPNSMEQSLMNYAFRRDGAMPWRELDCQWSATWPNSADLNSHVATLHEKFWLTGPSELRALWWAQKLEMEAYFGNTNTRPIDDDER